MARPLRIDYPGGHYHITAHGVARTRIFTDDDDRLDFLGRLPQVCQRFGVVIHAYCLMDTHYHLELEAPKAISAAVDADEVARDVAIYLNWRLSRHTNAEIGDRFGGIKAAAVSHACRRVSDALRADAVLADRVRDLEAHLQPKIIY